MIRRLLLVAVVLALVTASCTTADTTTTTGAPAATTSTATTTTVGTTQTDEADDTTSTTVVSDVTDDVAEAVQAEVAELIGVAEELRGLRFLEDPTVSVVGEAELAAEIVADLAEDFPPEDVEVETRLLRLLGLIDPGTDLLRLYQDVLGEQVAGFFDGDTGRLVVRADAELSPLTRSVVVHELVHALQDQHFDAWDIWQAMLDEDRLDEAAAYQALIEGDATYVQTLYLQDLSVAELLQVALEVDDTETGAFDDAPFFLREGLTFPYEDGFVFVQRLVDRGGLALLDATYEEPPATSEHVIHPDSYSAGEESLPPGELPDELAGYELYEAATWGELGLVQLFGESSGAGLAAQVGEGWGGDTYRIWSDADDVVFALLYVGDGERDATEVVDALASLAEQSMGFDPEVTPPSEDEPAPGTDEAVSGVTSRVVYSEATRFASIERIGARVLFVAATDPTAGAVVARSPDLP